MSETETSPVPAAGTGTDSPPAAAQPQFGAFSSSRGSGLARGKRAAAPATASATPGAAGYQPTAIEIVTTKSDYKNPFAEPAPAAPATATQPEPAAVPAPVVNVAPEAAPVIPAVTAPAAIPAPASADDAAPAAKAQLNILPTEETRRPSVSWGESGPAGQSSAPADSRPRRDERPVFRVDRRTDDRRDGPKPESREPRREQPKFEPRAPREQASVEPRAPQARPVPAPAPKKSGGFFGWLKGLFAGGDQPAAPEARPNPSARDGEGRRDDRPRHHHRGGRRQGGFQDGAPRGDGQQPRFEGGRDRDPQGGGRPQDGDGRRRRRRGGRGRNNNRGDFGPRQGGNGGPQGS